MADIKVDLNAEGINQAVADAIVKSVLGQTLHNLVAEEVNKLSTSWNNPLSKIIEQLVAEEVRKLVLARGEEIREKVRARYTNELVDEIILKSVNKFQQAVDRASY